MLSSTFITRERWGGGGGTSDVQLTGIIKWAAKIKNPKNPPGFQQNPPKFLDHNLAPGKSHAEFPNLNGMQYTAKSKKVALVTVHWLNWTLSIWAYGTMQWLTWVTTKQ